MKLKMETLVITAKLRDFLRRHKMLTSGSKRTLRIRIGTETVPDYLTISQSDAALVSHCRHITSSNEE